MLLRNYGDRVFLIDTNIFLEIILQQERKEEAKEFLRRIPTHDQCITEFSVNSIGLILFYRNLHDDFLKFLHDAFVHRKLQLLQLFPDEMEKIALFSKRFNLDFDDAYQYTAAERYNLQIISFDADFDRTERGRQTPLQVVERLKS